MASGRKEVVKVVLIDTQYVETDVMSFKSVVQRLTGKDSSVAWIEESAFAGQKRRKPVENNNGGVERSGTGGGVKMLSNGMSFKDLDRMMLEMPPLEELQWLWADIQ